ncbi:MAG: amino acid ABC transporter substrate-binding protein, partial [Jatrophihabitans sp.]
AANAVVAHKGSVVAILGPSSDEILSTINIFEQAQLPAFVMSGDAQFDNQGNQYFWRLVPPDADEGYAMAAWAKKNGFTRAAAVFASGSQAQADGPASKSGFKALGGQVVADVTLTPGQPSYSTEAAKVAAAHPQVIFYDAGAPESATFLAELKQQMGTLPPTYVVETEEEPGWIKAVSGAIGAGSLNQLTAFEAATPSTTQPGWQTFSQALKATQSQVKDYAQYLHDPFTLSYYDASNLVALAMLATNSTDPSVFNAAIMGLTEPGSGKTVVHDFASGKAALKAGQKIQYVGSLGAISLDKYHNIATPFVALSEGSNPKQLGAVPTDLMVAAAG